MYTYTWKKYLPVIRLLLKRSAGSVQSVTLNQIDFETGRRKPGCSFNIELVKGRIGFPNKSVTAQDLCEILMQDDVAKGLLIQNVYQISLNSDYELNIKNCSQDISTSSATSATSTA